MSDPEKTAQRRAHVAVMTAQGKSAAHIAAILRTAERTIVRDREHLGIIRPPTPPMTPEEIHRAKDLLDDGATCSEVARTLNRSAKTILRKFPEYTLNRHEAGLRAALTRQFTRLERELR